MLDGLVEERRDGEPEHDDDREEHQGDGGRGMEGPAYVPVEPRVLWEF